MSFILDALKKSESDRQRQTGPALFEVKVAPPKARFPVWAVAIVALLVINMMIVGWLLLRRSSRGDETSAAAQNAQSAAAAAPIQAPGTASMPAQPAGNSLSTNSPSANGASRNENTGSPPVSTMSAAPNTATGGSPNNGAPATFAPPAPQSANAQQSPAMSNPPARETGQQQGRLPDSYTRLPDAEARQTDSPAHLPDRDQSEPTLAGTPRDSGADTGASPDDYAPAADPGSPLFKGHVKRGTESGYMLYQDLAVTNGADLPQLRLDLHVYAAKPQDRFALINMRKLHEGDSLQGGVRVEAITPDGVVMSHNGTKFLLPRE
jgi:general secretion pathway protein B